MIKNICWLLLLVFTSTGCLRENDDGCPAGKLSISLKYTINVEGKDHLKEEIGKIDLYIFDDATGILIRIVPISQKQLINGAYFTDLNPGSYTFVAWAVDGQDISNGGYIPVDMTDYTTDKYVSPMVGQTKIDNFRVRLQTSTTGEYKVPFNEKFSDLYHARAINIMVTEGEQTINFDFTKNTNSIKIRVIGLQNIETMRSGATDVELFVVGTDDRYNVHNVAGEPSTSLRYQQTTTYPEPNTAHSEIHVLKLDMELHKNHPIMLHLRLKNSEIELIKPIDLLALILKMKDKNGDPIFKTQLDLDRWDEFPIIIKIGFDLSVTVGIEGFEIEDTDGEV